MKYLFFDVECSNTFHGFGKICEFGYVLTDDNLNKISDDDLVMSPGKGGNNRFYLKGRRGQRDLVLAYDDSYYYEQEEFPFFYKKIKALMEQSDTICFAYSSGNDLLHLNRTCKRYKLKPIHFTCYDVQKFATDYLECSMRPSLDKSFKAIVGINSVMKYQKHLPRDDSYMAKDVIDGICTLTNKSVKELLNEHPEFEDDSIEFLNNFLANEARKKEKQAAYKLFDDQCSLFAKLLFEEQYKGKRYSLSSGIKSSLSLTKECIDLLKKHGYIASKTGTDLLITIDNEEKECLVPLLSKKLNCKFITLEEFKKEFI